MPGAVAELGEAGQIRAFAVSRDLAHSIGVESRSTRHLWVLV
jgi:hypothetical protein